MVIFPLVIQTIANPAVTDAGGIAAECRYRQFPYQGKEVTL
jgi:hypothetical protein